MFLNLPHKGIFGNRFKIYDEMVDDFIYSPYITKGTKLII